MCNKKLVLKPAEVELEIKNVVAEKEKWKKKKKAEKLTSPCFRTQIDLCFGWKYKSVD